MEGGFWEQGQGLRSEPGKTETFQAIKMEMLGRQLIASLEFGKEV